jgi:protein-tyrosine phosphatase
MIPNKLARSSRPGWWDDRALPVVIPEWINRVRQMGVKSIVCLLTRAELKKYYLREGLDLLAACADAGFVVMHIPIKDDKTPPMTPRDRQRLVKATEKAKLPLLVHCSAGVDRTGCAMETLKILFSPPST